MFLFGSSVARTEIIPVHCAVQSKKRTKLHFVQKMERKNDFRS